MSIRCLEDIARDLATAEERLDELADEYDEAVATALADEADIQSNRYC